MDLFAKPKKRPRKISAEDEPSNTSESLLVLETKLEDHDDEEDQPDNEDDDDDDSEDEEEGDMEDDGITSDNAKSLAIEGDDGAYVTTFAELGVCPWLLESCAALGMKQPTPVQRCCVPAALQGHDVMGLAETGSGKTAAFALPLLQKLSADPYGVFALVLTPTRELALQIGEQVSALGAPLGVKVECVIGGVDMTSQSLALTQRPHVVVATPGRLIDHLEGAQPPALANLRFLVLDEADRILSAGFAPELTKVLKRLPASERRQTLLFSATMSDAIERLRKLAASSGQAGSSSSSSSQRGNIGFSGALTGGDGSRGGGGEHKPVARLFDLTTKRATPATLSLEYLFMPAQVKLCFLVQTLRTLLKLKQRQERGGGGNTHGGWGSGGGGDSSKSKKAAALKQAMTKASGKGGRGKGKGGAADNGNEDSDEDSDEEDESGLRKRARSAVIFTGSCKRCQEVTQVLLELGVDAVCLHSLLDQRRRTASLGKFKSLGCRLLVATDVASRGLDIPDVDLVINYDMPRLPIDFVHRSGRTARAGRRGRCLSLVTQHDVELVHATEQHVGRKLELYEGVKEDDVVPLLNAVAKAQRVARQRLSECGFDDQVAKLKDRAQKRRAQNVAATAKAEAKRASKAEKRQRAKEKPGASP